VRALRALFKAVFRLGPVRRLVERMYGVVVILGKPQSRGRLRLRGTDPAAQAIIDPNYFGEAADLDTLVAGVERARRLAAAPALAAWGNRELIPGARKATKAALRRFIRKNAMTTYHYAGTCRMSMLPDQGVVSPELEVHGVRGLRIADASVIPVVPVSALNAPSMLIGYRAARFIKEKERAEAAALAA
jgi:choline dehydrogenase-like flavoprotein